MAQLASLLYHGLIHAGSRIAKNMQQDIVAQGVELMLYGMGTVVLFLTLLVVATSAMSRLMMAYFPDPQPPAAPAGADRTGREAGAVDRRVVAAITAAIHRHRQ